MLWLGTRRGGISIFDRATNKFTHYRTDASDPTTISGDAVNHISKDSQGNIWVGTRTGLNRFDSSTQTFVRYFHDDNNPGSLSDDWVWKIFEDSQNRLWVSTQNGLGLLNRQSNTFVNYYHDPNNINSLSANSTRDVYEDNSGAVWIGTNHGVNRLSSLPLKFITYQSIPGNPNSLNGNSVTAIAVDDTDGVWVGMENGLDYFDGQNFIHYRHNSSDPNSLISGDVRSLYYQEETGLLWIGTISGLSSFDGNTFTNYLHDPNNPNSITQGIVRGLTGDKNGGIWISVEGAGMDHFDGQKFERYNPDQENPVRWESAGITSLTVDKDGILWFTVVENQLVHFVQVDTATRDMISIQKMELAATDIHLDNNGRLLLAKEKGLEIYDANTMEIINEYTVDDGLPGNSIEGIEEDPQGNLWISTNNGVSRFDPVTETFRNYDEKDGLQSNIFHAMSHAQTSDGQIFFGGTNGFNTFSPEQVKNNPYIPSVVPSGFELFNEPVEIGAEDSPLEKAIGVTDEIVLSYDQDVFTIEFTTLSYEFPEKNQFRYMMEGFDEDWRKTTYERRFATYTNLNPGNYTFRVKASNNDGVWNEEGLSLPITVTPPWWQTTWFRILAAVLILGTAYTGYRLRVRSLEERSKELEILVTKRTKELDDFAHIVSHDLKAPLRGINQVAGWITEDYADKLDDDGKEQLGLLATRTQRMHNMINGILKYSRIGRTKEDIEQVKLSQFIPKIIDALAPPENIQITIEDELPTISGDTTQLTQVFQNLLSNAIKFMDKSDGLIRIHCADKQDHWQFSIADNGPGIEEEQFEKIFGIFQTLVPRDERESTGIGLAIVEKIIEEWGGKIWLESTVGEGSTFYFTVPKMN
ncbi:MAG: GHKL domain-containing protein [Chloroflexi bacterium]|nr:GHKL domain-containing protein [Chloroflexota bacterium]